ncbi:hypothetical protein Pfo_010313 [Paulownia fortunei]|nr:hypothetical protein Pfo_010313 [Paulownia fortunei]
MLDPDSNFNVYVSLCSYESFVPTGWSLLVSSEDLAPFMSELGLIKFRVLVEVGKKLKCMKEEGSCIEYMTYTDILEAGYNIHTLSQQIRWLLKLSQTSEVSEVPSFSKEAEFYLQNLIDQFNVVDAMEVKKIEKVTNHDVKAVLEFFHFACTSEDINNLAHVLMLKAALNKVILPVMDKLITTICNMATANTSIPMLSRTHGQPASPTTFGKEMAIFAYRLSEERKKLSQIEILGKFAGAVGNYNAHLVAYPDINWPQIAEEFVTSLGISFNPYVTQIEPHDHMVRLFNSIILFNNIIVGFDEDIWGYISLGYLKQITKDGEIGSSTMPHKVNPIDFEHSKSNCLTANGGLLHLSTELLTSRWQRDLTDSSALRNMGVGLGHSVLAYKSAIKGIAKLQVNEASLVADLDQSWEVMRRYGVPKPYEKLKALTRGRAMSRESIREFIERLDIPIERKKTLLNLTPHTYVGAAVELAKNVGMVKSLVNGVRVNVKTTL